MAKTHLAEGFNLLQIGPYVLGIPLFPSNAALMWRNAFRFQKSNAMRKLPTGMPLGSVSAEVDST